MAPQQQLERFDRRFIVVIVVIILLSLLQLTLLDGLDFFSVSSFFGSTESTRWEDQVAPRSLSAYNSGDADYDDDDGDAQRPPQTPAVRAERLREYWRQRRCEENQSAEEYCGHQTIVFPPSAISPLKKKKLTTEYSKKKKNRDRDRDYDHDDDDELDPHPMLSAREEKMLAGGVRGARAHFTCPGPLVPGDFAHCAPARRPLNLSVLALVPDTAVANITVPLLSLKPHGSAQLFSRWASRIRHSNISHIPRPYGACRVVAEKEPEGRNETAEESYNYLIPVAETKPPITKSTNSSPYNVTLVRFLFPPTSRRRPNFGPYACVPPSEVTVAWSPAFLSRVHGRNHIVVRLGGVEDPLPRREPGEARSQQQRHPPSSVPSSSSSSSSSIDRHAQQHCSVSVQAWSVELPGASGLARCNDLTNFKPMFPPAFGIASPRSKAALDYLTYSVEAAGISSLDLYAASPECGTSSSLSSSSSSAPALLHKRAEGEMRFCPNSRTPNDAEMLQFMAATAKSARRHRPERPHQSKDFSSSSPPTMTNNNVVVSTESDVLARTAALRCDGAQYQGFTNIIQSFVACALLTTMCERAVMEFPLKIHHATFGDIFDLEQVQRRLKHIFGITLRLVGPATLDGGLAVDQLLHAGSVPSHPKQAAGFASVCRQRRWATVFVGDPWPTRLNIAAADFHTQFVTDVLAPSHLVVKYARRLIRQMDATPGAGHDAAAAAAEHPAEGQQQQQQHLSFLSDKWIAMHLRLEDDAVKLSGKRGSEQPSVAARARKLRNYVDDLFPGRRVYLASGTLSADVTSQLPLLSKRRRLAKQQQQQHINFDEDEHEAPWASKDDFFLRKPWKKTYLGRYFNGQPVNITNATGSAIDMHVLINAPVTVVAEFSSFGEVVAATRCARGLPVFMYDVDMTVFSVNCDEAVLFRRNLHEQIRAAEHAMRTSFDDARSDFTRNVKSMLASRLGKDLRPLAPVHDQVGGHGQAAVVFADQHVARHGHAADANDGGDEDDDA